MKKIDSGESAWESSIFNDLAYIKKHLRYPWKRGLSIPVVFWGSLLLLLGLFYAIIFMVNSGKPEAPKSFLETLVHYPIVWCLFIFIALYRYVRSLRFRVVSTGMDRTSNRQLIAEFLQKRQLLVYHHPESDDIMQIISRPLFLDDDRREALVFIADEQRVLINSHFTGNKGWKISLGRRHDRTIATDLHRYVLSGKDQGNTGLRQNFY